MFIGGVAALCWRSFAVVASIAASRGAGELGGRADRGAHRHHCGTPAKAFG
ncbi:MAG: hypothetical protein L6Q68_15730 [Aquabacterium sp.]|jgi:hypothetical protein|nr:hypothetical protein [Aquabacterium sp.]